jgi:hypothetical protein
MDFVDTTLIRLADGSTRNGLFDQLSLEQIARAGYDLDLLNIEGQFTIVFDKLEIGFSLSSELSIEGRWQATDNIHDLRLLVHGLTNRETAKANAYWYGGVVVRVSYATSTIISVKTNWRNVQGIDAQILSDLGSLPNDAATLETERRTRLITLLQAEMENPNALNPTMLNSWLKSIDAESVNDLMDNHAASIYPNTMQITMSAPNSAPPSPLKLPISALIFIRPTQFSLAELFAETKAMLTLARQAGLDPARDARLPVLHSIIALWILPADVFDDAAWPGPTTGNPATRRLARRRSASDWLSKQGIALVTI